MDSPFRTLFLAGILMLSGMALRAQKAGTTGLHDSLHLAILEEQSARLKSLDSLRRLDSLSKVTLEQQLGTLQLKDRTARRNLERQLEILKAKDSLRLAEKKARIDSLRVFNKGVPVVPFSDTLFRIYTKVGSFTPQVRAAAITKRISDLADILTFNPDSVVIVPNEYSADLMYGQEFIMSVTDKDALWMHSTREQLAETCKEIIGREVMEYKSLIDWKSILKRVGYAALVIAVLSFLIYLIILFFRWTGRQIMKQEGKRIHGIMIRDYELFNKQQQVRAFLIVNAFVKWFLILIVVYLALPVIFGFFPWTESIARSLLHFFLDPAKSILRQIWHYLPNLFTIIVILVVFRFVLKGIRFLRAEIAKGDLKIPGFYADWANPTYQIIRILVIAFMVIVIFPYLPGSESPVFKGVSVFLGILFTFGSTGSLSNIIAGMILTYMRAFKVGDRVKIGEVTGDIIEKSLLVTRIRTIKNEIISIPNSTVMNSHTTNFSSDAPEKGLILYTSVTIGYDAPWRTIHKLLTDAAEATPLIERDPKPFVLQTSLDDFYVSYQINAYTKHPNEQASIYSDLHQNIQDRFNEAGMEIMSPHYKSVRDGNKIAIPDDYIPGEYAAPAFRVTTEPGRSEST
jgi:small-conductance mechanosensitive channel